MLSSQYQPLTGQTSRVKSEQYVARSGTPQQQQTSPRSPDDDPSRWASHECMAGWGVRVVPCRV